MYNCRKRVSFTVPLQKWVSYTAPFHKLVSYIVRLQKLVSYAVQLQKMTGLYYTLAEMSELYYCTLAGMGEPNRTLRQLVSYTVLLYPCRNWSAILYYCGNVSAILYPCRNGQLYYTLAETQCAYGTIRVTALLGTHDLPGISSRFLIATYALCFT